MPDSISDERWRGKIDALIEVIFNRVDVNTESMKEIREEVEELEKSFATYSARMTIIVGISSIIGTSITTALIQIITHAFIK